MTERIGLVAQNWTTGMIMITPFSFSLREMAGVYARTIGAMAEAYVASTSMTTNMIFAGMNGTRATTNFTRQNAKEALSINSNSARSFAQAARETVQVQGEGSEVKIDLPRIVARVLVREEQDQQQTPLNLKEMIQLCLVQLVLVVKVR